MTGELRQVSNLADIEAIEASGWPDDAPASTYEAIRRSAERDPSALALSFFLTAAGHRTPETWTYRNLLSEITRTANGFHALGADRDTVIAYILPNLPETHFVVWGGEAAGIVFGINPLLEASAIRDLLRAADAEIVVTLAPFPATDTAQKVMEAIHGVESIQSVVLVDLGDRGPGAGSGPMNAEDVGLPAGVGVYDFGALRRSQPADGLVSGRVIDPADLSSFFCTGGTTGTPKIARRCHRNEVANAISTSLMLSGGIAPGKNLFCGLPMFHVNAVLVTGLVPFLNGAHVILGTPQGYRAPGLLDGFWEIVQHHKIHFFSAVPTVYTQLLEQPVDGFDLSSLEYGLCGAAPLPVEVMRRFEATTGLKMLEGYGLTEGTCVSSATPPMGERRVGSIGIRIPFQQMKAVVLDETRTYVRDCMPDEIGALVIRGPNVFEGYVIEAHNVNLWLDLGDGQRWLDTGDRGRQDPDGYFWLTGRTKELIIRGGHNIDPAQIEQQLYEHPAVRYAAAVGRPEPRLGELPVAYVQLKDGVTADEQELLAFAEQRIGERAARPKAVHLIDQMPMTGVGKIFKPALSRREIEKALTAALHDVGITEGSVRMDPDQARPNHVIATVPASADREFAERALGAFPFPFTITGR